MGWLALDLGGLTPILYGFIERDEIVEMLAALTGQKLLFNYMRIGGVNGDLNHEFLSRLGDWMSHAGQRHRGQPDAHQRERDLRPAHARPGRRRPRDGAPDVPHRAAAARHRHPLRRPPRASVQRLPGARVRDPDARGGRLLRALPAPPRRDQAEHPHHRPGPARDARRPDHGQAAAAAPAAPGPGVRGHREPARPVRRATP